MRNFKNSRIVQLRYTTIVLQRKHTQIPQFAHKQPHSIRYAIKCFNNRAMVPTSAKEPIECQRNKHPNTKEFIYDKCGMYTTLNPSGSRMPKLFPWLKASLSGRQPIAARIELLRSMFDSTLLWLLWLCAVARCCSFGTKMFQSMLSQGSIINGQSHFISLRPKSGNITPYSRAGLLKVKWPRYGIPANVVHIENSRRCYFFLLSSRMPSTISILLCV